MGIRRGEWGLEPRPSPPPEVRLFTPGIDKPLETPVDQHGLIDVKELIQLVKSTVEPGFTWKPTGEPDKHHLYWRRTLYPDDKDSMVNPHKFRELATNKILVPEMFHHWLHQVTQEPPVPCEEVMQHRIDAQLAVIALFNAVRISKKMTRLKKVKPGIIEKQQAKQFEIFSYELQAARTIPVEFQLLDLSDCNPETVDDMHDVGHRLGELVVGRTMTRVRDVFRPLAA